MALSLLACSSQLHAEGLNEFYANFLDLLKNDRASNLETLVRTNRDLASKCLNTIQTKIQGEENQEKAEAYGLVTRELEELIAVTDAAENCSLAEKIYQRGQQASVPDEKLMAFSRVVRLCPSHAAAYSGLGEIHKHKGRFDDALINYEKALALNKEDPEALLGLGETFLNAGLYQRSLPYLEGILAIEPDNRHAKRSLELCRAEIAKDNSGLLLASDISDRLRTGQERLMCMCPHFSKLNARLRLHEVTFSTSSTTLCYRAKRQLDELALALKSDTLKSGHYLIEGHCDKAGLKDYNQALSEQRARAVRKYLVDEKMVPASFLSVAGVGDSRSWTTNETTAGRRANRRIEILSVSESGSSRE